MVGRQDTLNKQSSNYFYFIKLQNYKNQIDTIICKNSDLWGASAKVEINQNISRSDYLNFGKNGMASYCIFKGKHTDYHQPTDTPDKLDYQTMQNIARTFFATVWELSGMKKSKHP